MNKINGKMVTFRTGDTSVICPQCGYYNSMKAIRKYATCRRCNFVIDEKTKYFIEMNKLLNYKIKSRRKRREERRH